MYLPEAVADDYEWRAAGFLLFFGQEAPAQDGFYSQNVKIVCGDKCAPDELGPARAGERDGLNSKSSNTREALVLVAQVSVVGIGKWIGSLDRSAACKCRQFARMRRSRNGIQQGRVDPAENGCVGANAEGQSEHGKQCKCRSPE